MGSRIMKNGELGRYQYLEDLNWTPEPYVLDYETNKRYYPSNSMNALTDMLNELDYELKKLKMEYELGVETKLYSRRKLEEDNERLKIMNNKLTRHLMEHVDINAEIESLISYYDSKIIGFRKIYPDCNTGCLIKEFKYKIEALKELQHNIKRRQKENECFD